MKIRPGLKERYQKWLDVNQDEYGSAVFGFAERWAELLEKDIEAAGDAVKAIRENAEQRGDEADTEGITGFMYGCAVDILSHAWEYGEILRQWHNQQYDYSGDGCVNPAIMTIGK